MKTDLVWQSLAASIGTTLPGFGQVGDWRVATQKEFNALVPFSAGQTQSVSPVSDVYKALSFFTQTAPKGASCIEGWACFSGWAVGWPYTTETTSYEDQFAQVSIQPDQNGLMDFSTMSTIGSYPASYVCPNGTRSTGLFMVRAVPEGRPAVLMALGLLAMGLTRRVWRR